MNRLATGLALVLMAGAASAATPLVDVDWIKAHSCDANVRVLDVRSRIDGASKATYLQGHIPCAVYTDYFAGWRSKVGGVPGQLSPVDKLEAIIGSLGIDNQTHVVLYHAGKKAVDMGTATRMYWTFKVLGHDEVSILDGGWRAYVGNPAKPKNSVEKGDTTAAARKFQASLRKDMIASKQDVAAVVGKGVPLVDMRPNDQFIGVNRHGKAKRPGTIPGARNLPESWVTVNGGGKFRSTGQLSALYEVAAVPASGKQVYFCNSGHWASLGWFASSELMGNKEATLYDGSMIEWSADSSLPMDQKVMLK